MTTKAAAVPVFELAQAARTLRESRAALIDAREDERRRIARNLHDDLGQLLLVLKLEVQALRSLCATPTAWPAIDALQARVDETVEATRRIVDDLRPSALDDLGLNAALDALARRTAEGLGIEVTLRCDEDDPPIADRAATTLYRCVQEALTNAARHAQATDIAIELFCDDDAIRLTVQDNGVGLPADGAQAPAAPGCGHGLRGLRERIEAFDGVLEVGNAPGAGVRLHAHIPRGRATEPARD